ncbi:hypothetical protein GCM10025868_12370 [Angustibacter aerolatus]|uniref:Uncharacterized protein n=1 Tax=Angustibacter aerolatus TaxID=1162965 RepID=A0ABQ6JDW9_9ACTN|nr:hypothetical protein GCM10025868_12370 [Angustibacter aerolatus]
MSDSVSPRYRLEAALLRRATGLLVQVHPRVGAGLLLAGGVQRGDVAQVGDRDPGGEVLLVRLGERAAVHGLQARRLLLAHLQPQRLGEVLVPGAGGGDEPLLQRGGVDVGQHRPARHPDDEVQAGEHRLGDARGVVDALPSNASRRISSMRSRICVV